jgi:hypothetical protein
MDAVSPFEMVGSMSDFSVRSDSVDVEQIMQQIRGRIRDKRGVDYTEQQIQELANAKLEKFLDGRGIRSDLLEQYRAHRLETTANPPMYAFEDTTLFESDKAIVRFFRALLRPFLKLFFNYNVLSQVLHTQAAFNRHALKLHESDPLYYELVHNLVVELTRSSIEVKNLRMRVDSLQSRLEFTERRGRALEGVVQYKPEALRGAPRSDTPPPTGPAAEGTEPQGGVDPITGGDSVRTRRRRRRRGRRGQGAGTPGSESPQGAAGEAPEVDGEDDGGEDGGPEPNDAPQHAPAEAGEAPVQPGAGAPSEPEDER